MSCPITAGTGGLLRALAHKPDGVPSFPDFEAALTSASLVIVPGLVLAEVDYFLRQKRAASASWLARSSTPRPATSTSFPFPPTSSAHWSSTQSSKELNLGLVDGMVAAVAERRKVYRVLTTDRRDFAAVRVGPRHTQDLELLP